MFDLRCPNFFHRGGQVASPLQAIVDFEREHAIPEGYVNFCISSAGPSGAWQRLERGEMVADAAFYRAFQADLARADIWAAFWRQRQRRRRQVHPAVDSSSSSSSSAAAT